MTGWLLICIGGLALAFVGASAWNWTVNEDKYSGELANQRIKRELNEMEIHRPHHFVEWPDDNTHGRGPGA